MRSYFLFNCLRLCTHSVARLLWISSGSKGIPFAFRRAAFALVSLHISCLRVQIRTDPQPCRSRWFLTVLSLINALVFLIQYRYRRALYPFHGSLQLPLAP
eukprot:gnl/MRDRNA2_/MRDRNA2_66778_c0_seq2.p2 gnl/MRDRNA2_/MRDRNA2_66778_c0~~gnl/MRDRNA2_/MRDRNA2_66778_c0_seq2.p2  ORF type:complete len:101 (-),score=0.89 gnl/MRDRNA2_/MRDRNA2_66778_c0_seq2:298-600(-)